MLFGPLKEKERNKQQSPLWQAMDARSDSVYELRQSGRSAVLSLHKVS